jgi:hypothetical protein
MPAAGTSGPVHSAPRMSSFPEVFPHDDRLSRFIVAMSMARNDVGHALERIRATRDTDEAEFTYWVRVVTGHFFEAEYALKAWRREAEEVRDFIRRLPRDGKEELTRASKAIQELGSSVLEHSRNRTFHYPYPTSRYPTELELETTLRELRADEATVVYQPADPGRFRLHFADDVALALALGKFDGERLREQGAIAAEGAIGFYNFATRAWQTYCDERGLEIGPPPPEES